MNDEMRDCECSACDGGCDMVGAEMDADEFVCTECLMGIHKQDRGDDD